MALTSDHQLATQVARELSSPEPAVHFGATLLVATIVSSPVLGAAAMGQRPVPTALAWYLAALVAAWVLVGLVGGALAMFGRSELLADHRSTARDGTSGDPRGGPVGEYGAEASTPAASESVGSNGAH